MSGDSRSLIKEGFLDLFRGYMRLGGDPSLITAKNALEFLRSVSVVLDEKVQILERLVTFKEEHIRILKSRDPGVTSVIEMLGHSDVRQNPTTGFVKIIWYQVLYGFYDIKSVFTHRDQKIAGNNIPKQDNSHLYYLHKIIEGKKAMEKSNSQWHSKEILNNQ